MANPEHVATIKQGAEAIAAWREKNPEVRLDLSEANLNSEILLSVDLSGADLHRAKLFRAVLQHAKLTQCELWQANLAEADLFNANLTADG